MKRIYKIVLVLIVILIFGIVVLMNSGKKNEKTIVDYYETLPNSFFYYEDLGEKKYTLSKKNGVWVSKSYADYDLFPIVDLKRGFIEINDEGTGGSNVSIKLFLLKKLNDTPIIAITKGGFDGFYFDSVTRFFILNNKTWVKVKNVLPKLVIEHFLNKNYRNLSLQKDSLINQNLTLLVRLNRNLPTASIKPNFDKYDFLIRYNQNTFTQQPLTKIEHDKIFEFIKNISIESFQLEFNSRLGIFEVKDSIIRNRENTEFNKSDKEVILDRIAKLKIVRELASYIDSASQKKRSLKLILEEENHENSDYITVKAVEDNGGNFVTHLIFQVQKDNLEISLYNPIDDKYDKTE